VQETAPNDGSPPDDDRLPALTAGALAALHGLPGLRPRPLRSDHAETVVHRNGVPTTVRSELHRAPGVDWLRITRIDNPRGTHILNVAAYPAPDSRVPVLHVETVVLRGRLFIVVLEEAHVLPEDRAPWPADRPTPAALLGDLRARHVEVLPDVAERPEWARGILDEATLWSRPNTAEAIVPGLQCLVDVVRHWADAAAALGGERRTDPDEIDRARARRGEICRACIEGGPSRPFLRTFFTEEWADGYIEEFLFPFAQDAPRVVASDGDGTAARAGGT